jgi:hypothetical protein
MKEILIKAVLYGLLAVVTLIVAMQTADCDEVSRILYLTFWRYFSGVLWPQAVVFQQGCVVCAGLNCANLG